VIAWAPAPEPTTTTPRVVVAPERIPTLYMADVVRHMRPGSLALNPALIGDGLDIDDAMRRADIDADDALTAWRAAS
jgi:hypothetical protein